jgi:hypothetical protein
VRYFFNSVDLSKRGRFCRPISQVSYLDYTWRKRNDQTEAVAKGLVPAATMDQTGMVHQATLVTSLEPVVEDAVAVAGVAKMETTVLIAKMTTCLTMHR